MKCLKVSPLLVVSVFVFMVACAGLVWSQTVVVEVSNSKCRTLADPAAGCFGIGTTACQENDGPSPGTAGCVSCGATSAIPTKVCVYSEGEHCVKSGNAQCGTAFYSGSCEEASGGVWYCDMALKPNEQCPSDAVQLCN